MKKILNYLLVIALVIVQFIPVADAATITINKAVKDQTYNAYKIFDVTNAGNSYAYSIDSSNDWFEVVKKYATDNEKTFTLKRVGNTTKYVVVPGEKFSSNDHAKSFAAYLNENLANKTATASAKATGQTVEITVDEAGYYFVDSSLGALCILHTAATTMKVDEKNTEPTIKKEASQTTASVGQEVTFTVTVTAGGAADTSYIVHDKMTDGLDLVANTIEIKVNDAAVSADNYTITTSDHGFDIEFKQTYTATLAKNTDIVITYKALVNEKAIETSNVTNEATLTYGQSSSTESKVIIKNYDFELVKVNEAGEQLSGAKFKLYDAKDNEVLLVKEGDSYRPAKAGEKGVEIEAGKVRINGLASGTYFLEETQAPEGYNQLVARHKFEIKDADLTEQAAVKVVNTTGTILPSTGGMGIVLFLTIGTIMVIGFGVLLVTKLRLSKMSI